MASTKSTKSTPTAADDTTPPDPKSKDAVPTGEVDVVQMVSRRADGTPDQTPDFKVLGVDVPEPTIDGSDGEDA